MIRDPSDGSVEELRKKAFEMLPEDQYRLAFFIAENIGFVLVNEPTATAEDIKACCQSTLIGFRDELTERNIEFICDQISRKAVWRDDGLNEDGSAVEPRPDGTEPISKSKMDALKANYQRTHG